MPLYVLTITYFTPIISINTDDAKATRKKKLNYFLYDVLIDMVSWSSVIMCVDK